MTSLRIIVLGYPHEYMHHAGLFRAPIGARVLPKTLPPLVQARRCGSGERAQGVRPAWRATRGLCPRRLESPALQKLVAHDSALPEPEGPGIQELRCSRNFRLQGMAGCSSVHCGYGREAARRFARTSGKQQRIFARKLHMGECHGAGKEPSQCQTDDGICRPHEGSSGAGRNKKTACHRVRCLRGDGQEGDFRRLLVLSRSVEKVATPVVQAITAAMKK